MLSVRLPINSMLLEVKFRRVERYSGFLTVQRSTPQPPTLFKGQLWFYYITVVPLGKLFSVYLQNCTEGSLLPLYYFYTLLHLSLDIDVYKYIFMSAYVTSLLNLELLMAVDHTLSLSLQNLALCWAYTCSMNIWTLLLDCPCLFGIWWKYTIFAFEW